MLVLRMSDSGVLIYSFVLMRNTEGIPSGPAAEFLFSLLIATSMLLISSFVIFSVFLLLL